LLGLSSWQSQSGLPIQIDRPQASWRGRNLHVTFNIQYVKDDGGNQQGRILILAQGQDRILAYPDNLFAPGAQGAVGNWQKGEYFSVSRFRAVQADLGSFDKRDSVETVEALLVDSQGNLLMKSEIAAPRLKEPSTGLPHRAAPEVKPSLAPPAQAPAGTTAPETSPPAGAAPSVGTPEGGSP
jgi:hypothetical protein